MSSVARVLTALSLEDLRAFDFPELSWVVEGLIPAATLSLLVGRPKAGKSLLALDMLACVASGEPFIERATTGRLVLYAPAEDALPLVRQRLEARIGSGKSPPLKVIPLDGSVDQWVRIDSPTSFATLAATVSALRPGLLVLDPLREIHDQPENDADAMAAVLRPLRQLAHESNCAIVVVHHRNKHGADPSTAARGSSAIAGSVDQTITLDVPAQYEGDAVPIGVVVEGRYGPRQRFAVRLGAGLRWDLAEAPSGRASAEDRIVAALEGQGDSLSAADLVLRSGLAEKTIMNNLARLQALGAVQREGTGRRSDPYVYRLSTNASGEDDDAAGGRAGVQLRVRESIRTCRTCGGNLWREIAPDTWRCAACEPAG